MNQYLCRILDVTPEDDDKIWGIFRKHPQEYYTATKIRDAAQSIASDFKRNFLLGRKGGANFAIMGYIQRTSLLENEKDGVKGLLVEWKEVRIGDECSRTLLKLQSLTNLIQAAEEGKLTQGKPNVAKNALRREQKKTENSSVNSKWED